MNVPTLPTKIDLLLAVDNSKGMVQYQSLLAQVVPELLERFTNPLCIDSSWAPMANESESGGDSCPDGSTREFQTITDIHIGVISSSLGFNGADTCVESQTGVCPQIPNSTVDDNARLLDRLDPCSNQSAQTFENKGFFVWDPQQVHMPPGDSDITEHGGKLHDTIMGGCADWFWF